MRYRERAPLSKLPNGYKGDGTISYADVCVNFNSISDINNGKKGLRPESPCEHTEVKYNWLQVPTFEGEPSSVQIHPQMYSKYIKALVSDSINDHESRCFKKMSRLINKQIGSFSSLNFLYELRELPDLFKKIRRPQDLRPIDWYFAILPTISDIKNALSSYDNAVASLNDKLKKYRSIPCDWTSTTVTNYVGSAAYGSGNNPKQFDLARVTTRMRGEIVMDVPVLSKVNPQLFSLLDSLSVDVSAGNAWNALPWSWFADWFFPIGDYLESLPSTMKPACRFIGTISHEITSVSEVYTQYVGPAYNFPNDKFAGTLNGIFYQRIAYAGPVSGFHRWSIDSLSKPSQIAILRDIMFPVKENKSSKRTRR